MKKALITSLIFISGSAVFPQTQERRQEEIPYIEVTGIAELEVVPNEIFIKIIISEKYIGKAKVSIEEQEVKLRESLKLLGIELRNLSLADADADYVKIGFQKKDLLTKKEYQLNVSDALMVGKVFEALEKLEIADASIKRVSHTKIDSLRREVRINAIKAGKEKANYLLSAIGEQPGRPLIIREENQDPSDFRAFRGTVIQRERMSNDSWSSGEPVQEEITFQKIKIRSAIYIKYEIK